MFESLRLLRVGLIFGNCPKQLYRLIGLEYFMHPEQYGTTPG